MEGGGREGGIQAGRKAGRKAGRQAGGVGRRLKWVGVVGRVGGRLV